MNPVAWFLVKKIVEPVNIEELKLVFKKLENQVAEHAFHPPINPVENNIWGTEYGMGSFKKHIPFTIYAKTYNFLPFEKYIQNGKNSKTQEKPMKMQIIGKLGNIIQR